MLGQKRPVARLNVPQVQFVTMRGCCCSHLVGVPFYQDRHQLVETAFRVIPVVQQLLHLFSQWRAWLQGIEIIRKGEVWDLRRITNCSAEEHLHTHCDLLAALKARYGCSVAGRRPSGCSRREVRLLSYGTRMSTSETERLKRSYSGGRPVLKADKQASNRTPGREPCLPPIGPSGCRTAQTARTV